MTSPEPLSIGEQIRALRDKRGMRQEDLAKAVGVTRTTIIRLERGRHLPSQATLAAIRETLAAEDGELELETALSVEDAIRETTVALKGLLDGQAELRFRLAAVEAAVQDLVQQTPR